MGGDDEGFGGITAPNHYVYRLVLEGGSPKPVFIRLMPYPGRWDFGGV